MGMEQMAEDTVNGGATNPQSDTPVTQPGSLDVHAVRKSLDALRAKFGADTPAGHRCSNLLVQLKNLESATGEQRAHLEKFIGDSMAELSRLSSGDAPHADHHHTPQGE